MVIILLNIFLLNVNFDKSNIRLHFFFLMSSILSKFLEDQKINNYVINQIFKI